jgi:hypothetical protein
MNGVKLKHVEQNRVTVFLVVHSPSLVGRGGIEIRIAGEHLDRGANAALLVLTGVQLKSQRRTLH